MPSHRLSRLSPPVGHDETKRPFIEIKLRLATPMIGGGSKTGGADPEHAFRAASIRGHLRWWWRATTGATCASLSAMRDREAALWGGEAVGTAEESAKEHFHSAVRVEVEQAASIELLDPCPGILDKPKDNRGPYLRECLENLGIPSYALGPLNAASTMASQKWVQTGTTLVVRLFWAHKLESERQAVYQAEVAIAVRCWILYGGIGARTRRGFGALDWVEAAGAVLPLLPVGIGTIPPNEGVSDLFPHLLRSRVCRGSKVGETNQQGSAPMEAWKQSIDVIHRFRKAEQPTGDRRPPKGTSSHSPWPEAGQIDDLDYFGSLTSMLFPRAALGMPLNFRFSGSLANLRGHVISVAGSDRFASPIICKPFGHGSTWYPIVVILNSSPPSSDRLELREYLDKDGKQTRIVDPVNYGRLVIADEPLSIPTTLYDSALSSGAVYPRLDCPNVVSSFERYLAEVAKWSTEPIR